MRKLPLCSSAQVIRVLEREGFRPRRKKSKRGTHRAYVKDKIDGGRLTAIVVLAQKEIPRGTLKSILEQAHISNDEFLKLLK